ncbi:MAG: TRAP transporter substrate-binding protein [Alphaproteobacteria bacterium]|nr:TRAP transporter substrate-binding protein [Alphaproteobacteria bacterium]
MADIDIRFGGYQGAFSVHNRAATVFGDTLAQALGDDLTFELTPNVTAQGHNAVDLLDMVAGGEMTLCYFASSYLADRVPEFALLDLPFAIRDRAQAYAMLDGPLCQYLADRIDEVSDFRVVAWWDNAFRHLSNGVRPIRRPQDCAGLKIRTLKSDLYMQSFTALGFEPKFYDVKDLVPSVASGAVDAQENAITNTYNMGIHNHHRWITLSGHFFGPAVVLCHKGTYDSWPAEVRAAVDTALATATTAQREFAATEEAEVLQKFDPAQNEVITLSEDERAEFAAAVQPVVEATVARFRDQLFEFLPD